MKNIWTIFKREIFSYINSPAAYVFIVIFLVLSAYFPLIQDNFFGNNEASLTLFFSWHPLLYLFLVPAAGMHTWADEHKSGTIELLLTMPISISQCIIAKFLAAWAYISIALVLTFPIVITICYLGTPDLPVVACGYLGSFLLSGACLAISVMVSSLTRSQIVSFIVSAMICLVLILIGMREVTTLLTKFLPYLGVDIISSFSLVTYFTNLQRGLLDSKDIIYYLSMILFSLYTTQTILQNKMRNI